MSGDGTNGATGSGSQSYCVAHGTLIETPSGSKPVEQLKVGHLVWAFDVDRREPVVTRVVKKELTRANETVQVGRLRVTVDHPVYVAGQWKPAGKLSATDKLLDKQLKSYTVSDIQVLSEAIDVYDLSVEGPENFFAGEVLVHNKSKSRET